MRRRLLDFFPSALAAVGLVGLGVVFATELGAFRSAVTQWVLRDLRARTELAAATLRVPLETGDFQRIHRFGDECHADGVRVTVFSRPGGIVFDSQPGSVGARRDRPEVASALETGEGSAMRVSGTLGAPFLYCARMSGEYVVRLAIPRDRVYAPIRRARIGFVLAGFFGGAGVLLVILFTYRQRARLVELARERDAQARLVEEMRKVESFRRDFIADVSHELKTPLTGILGATELLDSWETLPPDDRNTLLGVLKRESSRLNGLAQGILSLARLERTGEEGIPLARTETDLADIAREATERLRPRAEAAGVELRFGRMDSCIVACDAQLVGQAVANLIENAIRHSGAPAVEISVAPARYGSGGESAARSTPPCPSGASPLSEGGETGGVGIVKDHGVGIPEAERERVFERFHRVDASRAAETGGAGLGLAIVRRIARLHGGDVILEPAEPTGCRFSLKIGG